MNWDDEMSPVFSTPPGSPSVDPSTLVWSLTTNNDGNEAEGNTSATQVDMFATQEPSQLDFNGDAEVRADNEQMTDSQWSVFIPVGRKCRGAVLLNSSPLSESLEGDIPPLPVAACLFDCVFVTECVMRDCKDLVEMARMVYSDLSLGGRRSDGPVHVAQIDAFCQYMLLLARHLALEQRPSELAKLCHEMKHFLLDVGLIRQLATCAQLIKVSCQNRNSTLHAAMVVWVTAHAMFVLLDGVCPESANEIDLMSAASGRAGLVKQSTYLLADSLLTIAGVSPCSSMEDVLPCDCVANAWSLLLCSNNEKVEVSLWTTLQSLLTSSSSSPAATASDHPDDPRPTNTCESSMALVLIGGDSAHSCTVTLECLALLSGFDERGSQAAAATIRPLLFLDVLGHLCRLFGGRHASLLQRGSGPLIALIANVARVSSSPVDGGYLHRMMRTCTDLFTRIEPAPPADVVVHVAWEEICKQLSKGSSSFDADDKVLPQTGSSSQWMERIVRYADLQSAGALQSNASIWQCFIRMTVVVCRNDAVWQRVRPRIYSKLPMGKLRALGVVGLKNVVALWLTLAYAIDMKEVTSKLLSLVLPAVLSVGSDLDRLQLYFRTVSVLLRWHHEQSLDCTQLSTLLLNCYNESLKLVNETSVGRSVAALLSELITDTVEALVAGGDGRFPGSASNLLEAPLQPLIKYLPETTVERMMETLGRVAEGTDPENSALLTTMEERVWPMALERWRCRRTASTAVARLLAGVTRALLLSRRRSAVEKLNAAVCDCLSDREERRPPTTAATVLLATFFADRRVFIEMGRVKKAPRDVALVVACWLCIAFLDERPDSGGGGGGSNLHSVSRAVGEALLQPALPAFHAAPNHTTVDVCHCLFSALGELGRQNLAHAQDIAQEWISPIVPLLESQLNTAAATDSTRFRSAYRLLGDLLATCAPVLYRTGIHVNKCPLVRIYNGLIEKQVLRTTASNVVDNRPVFLALGGLAAGVQDLLGFVQSGFLQRLVCQVVYHTAHIASLADKFEKLMLKSEQFALLLVSKGVEYALMQTDGAKGRSFVTLCCRTLSRTANESVRRRSAMAMKTALSAGTKTGTWLAGRAAAASAASADLAQAIGALNTPPTAELAAVLSAL